MRAVAALAVAAVLALGACSGDDDGDDAFAESLIEAAQEDAATAPACADMFAPGRPVADVVAAATAGPCLNAGELTYAGSVSYDCPGGTVWAFGDFGYGRDGGTWQPGPQPDDPCSA